MINSYTHKIFGINKFDDLNETVNRFWDLKTIGIKNTKEIAMKICHYLITINQSNCYETARSHPIIYLFVLFIYVFVFFNVNNYRANIVYNEKLQ